MSVYRKLSHLNHFFGISVLYMCYMGYKVFNDQRFLGLYWKLAWAPRSHRKCHSVLSSSPPPPPSLPASRCRSSVHKVLNWSRWHSWATHDACSCSLIMSLLCRWPVCFDSLAPTAVQSLVYPPSSSLLSSPLLTPLFPSLPYFFFPYYGSSNSVRVILKEDTNKWQGIKG